MKRLRVAWKLLRLTEHLLTGALINLTLIGVGRRHRMPAQWWHARLCRILGLRIETRGRQSPGAHLMVANHISWLDIPILGSLEPVVFLSKSEIRSWPLVGWMSVSAGTLFIERGNHQSARISGQIRQKLEGGRSVLFFPEGTTTDGTEVRRFHPRLFAAAQQSGARLQPIALRFLDGDDRLHPTAPFVDDDPFFAHLLRILPERVIRVQVAFLEPLEAGAADRKTLAERTRSVIQDALGQ